VKKITVCLGLAVTLCLTGTVTARTPSEIVNSYLPLREIVKPLTVSISPDAGPGYIVVKFERGVTVESGTDRIGGAGAASVRQIVRDAGLTDLEPMISGDPADIHARRMTAEDRVRMNLPDLSLYFRCPIDNPEVAARTVSQLNRLDEVEIAYFEPPTEVASIETPTTTPNFESGQTYLDPATDGVDARAAWTLPGGSGNGVRIIDVERGWQLTHEDLSKGATAIVLGTTASDNDHGTAVMGEMVADRNGWGMTGIVPDAAFGGSSYLDRSTAWAIDTATKISAPGDLILLEVHRPGPRYDFQSRDDQLGYIAIEWWQADFDAILNAYAHGVIVTEAAGNGAEDLDDPIYLSYFDRSYRNSHAIICGAGYPPSSGSQDRSKLGFSNYGSRVDLQGYGTGVYTTGYGDLYDGGTQDSWYASSFGGTSSASPIVTGAVAALSGIFQELWGTVIDADSARGLLLATGSPQTPSWDTRNIGPRPDLKEALGLLFDPIDSVWYDDIEIQVNDKAPVPVMLANSHPVSDIYLPFKLTGPASIYIDSLTRGPRTAAFKYVDIVYDNRFAGEIGYRLRADDEAGASPLQDGSGVVAYLWVRSHFLAQIGQVEVVDSAWLGSATRLRLVSYFDDGYPDYFSAGSITIAPPACTCPYQGDFDADGFLTALDLSAMIDILFAGAEDVQDEFCPVPRADFDCDGFSTALDLSGLIDHLFAGGPGPCDPCAP
jgi:subtilisin family serine protease